MKLFVAVCLGLILISQAEEGPDIDCFSYNETCQKSKEVICGELSHKSESFCLSFNLCAFSEYYCQRRAVFGYYGDCVSTVGCTNGVPPVQKSQIKDSKKKNRFTFWKRTE